MAQRLGGRHVEPYRSRPAHGASGRPGPPTSGLHEQGYYLSEIQADAILRMSLRNLTGLDQEEIVGEYKNLMSKIIDFVDILSKPDALPK